MRESQFFRSGLLIQLTISFLGIFLLSRCSNENSNNLTEESQNISEVISDGISEHIGPRGIANIPIQIFNLDPSRHQIIQGRNGSSFLFPALCFMDDSNNIVNSEIKVELTEVIDIHDFVRAGIGTRSDTNLLESEGCYLLNALRNNRKLKLRPGYCVYGSFPRTEGISNMQFYRGKLVANDINWILDSTRRELSPLKVPDLPRGGEPLSKQADKINAHTDLERQIASLNQEIFGLMVLEDRIKYYLSDNINNKDVKYIKKTIEVEEGVKKQYYVPSEFYSNLELLKRHKYSFFNDDLFLLRKRPSGGVDTIYYGRFSALNISLRGDRSKVNETKDFQFYMADSVNARIQRLNLIQQTIANKKKTLNLLKPEKGDSLISWESQWKRFTSARTSSIDYASAQTIHQVYQVSKNRVKNNPYLYSILEIGEWLNIDKLYETEAKFAIFQGECEPGGVINVVSQVAKVHFELGTNAGHFSFSFPQNVPFMLILKVPGKKERIRKFSGTKNDLGVI